MSFLTPPLPLSIEIYAVPLKIIYSRKKPLAKFLSFLGQPVNSLLHGSNAHGGGLPGSGVSDLSNDSSPAHGYPDFPPSPDSWLGDSGGNTNQNNSTPAVHY